MHWLSMGVRDAALAIQRAWMMPSWWNWCLAEKYRWTSHLPTWATSLDQFRGFRLKKSLSVSWMSECFSSYRTLTRTRLRHRLKAQKKKERTELHFLFITFNILFIYSVYIHYHKQALGFLSFWALPVGFYLLFVLAILISSIRRSFCSIIAVSFCSSQQLGEQESDYKSTGSCLYPWAPTKGQLQLSPTLHVENGLRLDLFGGVPLCGLTMKELGEWRKRLLHN